MKKGLLVLTALASLTAFSAELQIKGGYDVFRRFAKQTENEHKFFGVENDNLEKGFVLNAEFFPVNKYRVEPGIGVEYNFGTQDLNYASKVENGVGITNARRYSHIPVYAVVKANVVQLENGDSPLAVVGKVGYSFVNENKIATEGNQLNGNKTSGGLYYALGLNSEYGRFVMEALASRTHLGDGVLSTSDTTKAIESDDFDKSAKVINKFGLTLGIRLGNLNRPEVVVEEPVEVVIEEPVVVVEEPKEEEVSIKGVLPTHCSTQTKECVIHGFKVDGRKPNEAEIESIKEIAEVVNRFAVEGVVNVTGHTDSTGSVAYNQKLSEARATNVAKLLREYGMKADIEFGVIEGKSELEPMDTNKTKEGRYNNRRVVLNFEKVRYNKK